MQWQKPSKSGSWICALNSSQIHLYSGFRSNLQGQYPPVRFRPSFTQATSSWSSFRRIFATFSSSLQSKRRAINCPYANTLAWSSAFTRSDLTLPGTFQEQPAVHFLGSVFLRANLSPFRQKHSYCMYHVELSKKFVTYWLYGIIIWFPFLSIGR